MISGEYGYNRYANNIDRMLDCKLLEKKVIFKQMVCDIICARIGE